MNTKKNILIISSLYIFYFAALYFVSATCNGSNWCDVREDSIFGLILFTFAPLVFLFLFSLITYKMRDEIFRAWWGFAWWWTLIIIVVTLFLQNASDGGGLGIGGAVSGAFDAFVLGILYVILVLVSLIKIVRTYFKLRTS